MPTALEERVTDLEAKLDQVLNVAMSHGDQHFAEGSDPAAGFFATVATANDLPTTRPVEQLYKIKGPPVLFYMVGPDGQREIGFSIHAASTGNITLTTTDVGEANAKDVTGATITLPKPGNYVVVAVFDFQADSGTGSAGVGILKTGSTVVDTPRGAIFDPGATGERYTITQTWRVTTTADDEVFKLSAYQVNSVTNSMTIFAIHTTIAAWGGLGGDTTSASHTHTHAQATSQTEDDHHLGFIGLAADGSPVTPDGNNRINLIGGSNVSLSAAANAITIASTGGGGVGTHDLLSASHPDTRDRTAVAGDIVFADSGGFWERLPAGPQLSVLVFAGIKPGWGPLAALAPAIDHSLLAGLGGDDHPRYPDRSNPEVIAGPWTWEEFVQHTVSGAPAATPAEDHIKVALIKDGSNLIWRCYGPTGATEDICTLANVAVAHTNTLTGNWIE